MAVRPLKCMCQIHLDDGWFDCGLPVNHEGEHEHTKQHIWRTCELYKCEHKGVPQYYYNPSFVKTEELREEFTNLRKQIYFSKEAETVLRHLERKFGMVFDATTETEVSGAKALRTPPTTEVVGIRAGDIL